MANSVNRYFEGLLVGGTLGFVLGLLTAPKPGSELRRELADSADDMLKQANGNWMEIKDRMGERVQPLADKAEVYRERLGEKASVLKSRVSEKTGELMDKACELTDQAKDKLGELKDKAADLKGKMSKDGDGADLLNNYMGNNSGPMYTSGAKASPDASAMPASDSCSN